ncbi:acyltransferase [Dethiosulfatarculus sandiegensis]|uniref:Acetyltransferase n=1 Tax=Dethiosulfatarculus sandiegensis TaxID=1429043 RepID=A0A0D2G7X9_9BACT|nr:acyltransferase [Dethiosulfatarculus sandiegensis]KIX11022.1 hypothetical protein X474_27245 [Dethiosulfatarculus sandiegensis]
MDQPNPHKVAGALKQGGGLKAYQDLVLGDRSFGFLLLHELVMLFSSWVPGALGVVLRKFFYPLILGGAGKGCLFGRGVTFRHPKKIFLGKAVVLDDGVMVDAKGVDNRGIKMADGVYIGRNSIVYTKGGDIELAEKANVSSNCILFSSNRLYVGRGTFIAAYAYLLSGGEYDMESRTPLCEQPGTNSRGETRVGDNVWIAAHAVVADGAFVGDDSVVAAGAVVRGRVEPGTLAAGLPAKTIRSLERK